MAFQIGKLNAKITADTKDFEKNLDNARKKTQTFGNKAAENVNKISKSLGKAKIAIGAFVAALAIKGTLSAIAGAVEKLDQLGDTANKIGFTTDALQELRFAASQVNVEQTALDTGLQRFTRRLGEARQGTGELKDALKETGIALFDSAGNARTSEDVLKDYADAIMNAGDSSEQLRLATKGFDTEGAALVNIFKGGAAAINDFATEARAAGLVIDESIIENAGEAGDKLDLMSKVLQTQATAALAQAAPAITSVGVAFAQSLPDLIAWMEGFRPENLRSISTLTIELKELENEISEVQRILNDQQAQQLAKSSPIAGNERNKLLAEEERLLAAIEEKSVIIAAREEEQAKRANERKQQLIEAQALAQEAAEKRAAIIKLETEAAAAEKAREKEKAAALKAEAKALEDKLKADEKAKETAEKAAEALRDQRDAWLDIADPMLVYQEKLLEIQALIQEFPDDAEALAEAYKKVAEEAAESLKDVKDETSDIQKTAAEMGATFTSAFEEAILNGGNFRDVIDGLINDIIRMTLRLLILDPLAKALSGGIGGFLGGLFGKAGGGVIQPNTATLVGERGPELIVPNAPARVLNNHTLNGASGGGGNIKVEIVNRGTPQQAVSSSSQTLGLKGAVLTIVTEDIRKNGPAATSLQQVFGLRRQS